MSCLFTASNMRSQRGALMLLVALILVLTLILPCLHQPAAIALGTAQPSKLGSGHD